MRIGHGELRGKWEYVGFGEFLRSSGQFAFELHEVCIVVGCGTLVLMRVSICGGGGYHPMPGR